MKREIKFRAWHKKNRKYYGVVSINFDLKYVVLKDYELINGVDFDDVILEPLVGYNYRDGIELYEGDNNMTVRELMRLQRRSMQFVFELENSDMIIIDSLYNYDSIWKGSKLDDYEVISQSWLAPEDERRTKFDLEEMCLLLLIKKKGG